jgi:hypothetical protein
MNNGPKMESFGYLCKEWVLMSNVNVIINKLFKEIYPIMGLGLSLIYRLRLWSIFHLGCDLES